MSRPPMARGLGQFEPYRPHSAETRRKIGDKVKAAADRLKVCTKCHTIKRPKEFPWRYRKDRSRMRQAICKACVNEQVKQLYRDRNFERWSGDLPHRDTPNLQSELEHLERKRDALRKELARRSLFR